VKQPFKKRRQEPYSGSRPVAAPTVDGLHQRLSSLLHDHREPFPEYAAKSRQMERIVLETSRSMKGPNFQSTSAADLRRMAELYDTMFFEDTCLSLARHFGLTFRWSSRMTRAGGKTTRYTSRGTILQPAKTHYEITLSSSLIFQTFQHDDREIRVCGCVCSNRFQAMQRIVEHELIHLSEMLVWSDSNCAASRFQSIAYRFFGHTEHQHDLVTQRERAYKLFDVKLGSRVRFEFEGREHVGIVNRITRRATVLVESPSGIRYSDGRRYEKFYIPISQLKPAS
jgi:hypothetical protein